jgi:hypothetical protein
MLRAIKQFQGVRIRARDGEIGKVSDVYFDDKEWVIRYVVVDTGSWLAGGRRVLIAPAAFDQADWEAGELPVHLTRDQVQNAPGIDSDKPVSRQNEIDLSSYYGWPEYWPPLTALSPTMPYSGAGVMPAALPGEGPAALTPDSGNVADGTPGDGDPHLRSGREVTGYRIEARDGRAGKVDDLLFNDETWRIDYMVVDTGGPLSSKKVMLAPSWVQRIATDDSVAQVDLDRESVEKSPEFDPDAILNQE